MPSARATPGSLHSVIAAQRTKPFVSLSHFFILLKFNLGDAFSSLIYFYLGASLWVGLLRISLRYRTSCGWFPFGSCESLAQLFYIKILFGRYLRSGLLRARYTRLPSANQALRIPIAFFYFVEI